MANVNNIDWSQYPTWRKIVAPAGNVYYVIPGTGYVYDPFLSQQNNRPVFFDNPEPEEKTRAEEKKRLEDQDKRVKDANSPIRQLGTLAAATAIPAAIGMAVNKWGPTSATELAKEKFQNALLERFGGITPQSTNTAAQPLQAAFNAGLSAGAGASGGAGIGAAQGLTAELTPSLSALEGTGATQLGPTLQSAGTSAGAVPPSSGFPSITSLLAQAPGTEAFGSSTLGSFLPNLGMVAGAYTGMQQIQGAKNVFSGKKLSGMQQAALALPTFGLSFLTNHIPGFVHKSISEQQKDRWGDLADTGITGAAEAFEAMHGEAAKAAGGGKDWNFEDAITAAKRTPAQFRGVFGNYDTFGNDWSTYTPQQQDSIILGLINADLYDPEKGDIKITDKDKAREIKDQVLAGKVTAPTIAMPSIAAPTTATTNPMVVSPPTPTTTTTAKTPGQTFLAGLKSGVPLDNLAKDLAKRLDNRR